MVQRATWGGQACPQPTAEVRLKCPAFVLKFSTESLSHPTIHCEETLSISYLLDPMVGARNVYGEWFAHGTLKDCCEGSV